MRSQSFNGLVHISALLGIVFIVYANTLGNSFHYDDSHSLIENRNIRTLSNIPRFFSDPALFSNESNMAMYRPVVLLSYAVNYALGAYRPLGYHLVNILFHATSVVLVYLLLLNWGRRNYAWWGAALWGLHPLHSQALNYISARAEIVAAAAVLTALLLLTKKKWSVVIPVYVLGLLAKSTAVVLVPLCFWQTLWQARTRRRWFYTVLCCGITGGYLGLIWVNGFLSRSLAQDVRSATSQIFTQTKALVYYLKLLGMPVNLSIEHAFYESSVWYEPAVITSALMLTSLSYLAWRGWQSRQAVAWGWGWFLAGMGLIFLWPLNVLVNEHRLYLASVGLAWIFFRGKPRYGVVFGTTLLLVWGLLTIQRNSVWKSEYTLWQDAAYKAPEMYRAQSNWGLALYNNGSLKAAQISLKKALRLKPEYAKGWNNLGLVEAALGYPQEARNAYFTALEINPDLVGAYNNLGRLELALGNVDNAAAYLHKAVKINPYYSAARLNLGLYYQRLGQYKAAARQYHQVIALEPMNADAYNNIGLLYQDMAMLNEARQALERASELAPKDITAQINLALLNDRINDVAVLESYRRLSEEFPERAELWQALGNQYGRVQAWSKALVAYGQANRLDPSNILLYRLWGDAYLHAGLPVEAVGCYKKVLVAKGKTAGLYNSLAAAYAANGEWGQAVDACRQALALDPENEQAMNNLKKLLKTAEQ